MKQLILCLLVLTVCAALAGCGDQSAMERPLVPESPLERAAADESKMVPLSGRFAGGGADFSGTLTHLGRFEGVFDADASAAVWTAADGDTVTNRTVSFVLEEELSPGVFRYEQELIITGGTGRFARTSGSATVVGLIDLDAGIYLGWIEGHISRPGGP